VTRSTASQTGNEESTPPVVERVDHRGNPNGLRVTFSELVSEATATDVGNYELDGGDLTIDSAELLENGKEVQLSGTWNFAIDSTHTLAVSDVEDLASTPNVIDPNPSTHEIVFSGGEGTLFDFNNGVPEDLGLCDNDKVRSSSSYKGSSFMGVTGGEGSQAGAALFTERRTVDQIKFEFKARIGDTSDTPADGFSFNVADDLPESVYPQSEEGYNATTDSIDGQGLMVAFDNWDSGGTDNSPSITVKYEGEVKGNVMTGQDEIPAIHQGDRWIDVSIDLQLNGTITVIYDGVTVFDQLDIGFTGLEDAQVGFGGRTGGAWESHWFDDLNINFQGGEVGPVEIAAEGQPQDVEVEENSTATFEVEAGGAGPFTYQWMVNGEPIEGATSRSYTTGEVSPDMDGDEYTVEVSNEFSSISSDPAVLTVIADTVAPEIASVQATDSSFMTVDVVFNERVSADTAENADNYSVDNGVSITGATLQSDQVTVVLDTTEQDQGTVYTLTVNGVTDIAAAANATSNAQASWVSWAEIQGGIARWMYNHIGNFVTDVYTGPGDRPDGALPFGGNPSQNSTFETIFESPRDVAANYGALLQGWVTTPESGDYTCYVASDDNSQLYLSTDDDPANATQIASEPQWNAYRDWTGTTRRDPANPENRSEPQSLEAGQRYYVEAVFNEGGGGDGMEVAWVGPGDPPIANEDPSISGEFLSTLIPGKVEPTLVSQTPGDGGFDVGNDDTIELVLEDGNTGKAPVDPDSVVMTVNGQEVTPTITRNTDGAIPTTTIQYDPDPALEDLATHNIEVTVNYGDEQETYSWSFDTDVNVAGTFVEGTRFIEAEDWNYDSGQWVEGGNGGPTGDPYSGGAYQDLVGTPDVDYNDEGGGGGEPLYRYAPGTDPAAQPGPATVDFGFVDRGSFEVESNWKVGWTAPGQWMNYTRDFPEEETTYDVYANISSGGDDPNPTLQLVTGDPTQPDQTVEEVGEFSGAASGDWATAIFYKMHAPGDPDTPGQVTLSGVNTLRLTIGGQMDVNYLAFVPAEEVQPAPDISVELDDSGNITLEWSGTLYSAPEVTGPYTEVTGAESPIQVSPDEAEQYYKSGN
jgi:hypothetical protein